MKRETLFSTFLILVTATVLMSLFYLPYWSVRKKTIAAFESEQMILAEQGIKGIESFFDTYDKALHYFSTQPAIIDLDSSGRTLMDDFYAIHTTELSAVTRIDATGRIIYTVPYVGAAIGKDVSGQLHNRLIMKTHRPVISDVFTAVQGFESIAFAYPVFDRDEYAGSISFLIPFARIASKYLDKIRVMDRGFTMMLSRNGVVLYCPIQEYVGKNAEECFADKPQLKELSENMMSRKQGSMFFKAALPIDDEQSPISRYAVYAPVNLPGNSFWSIMVASPENDVLATMRGFSNQWFMVTVVAICAVLLLSFLLTRTLARSREEKKRRVVEEQLVRLLDFTPMGMVVYNINGRVSYVNKAVVELFGGETAKEFLGKTVFEFIHPDFREFVLTRFKNLIKQQVNETAVVKIITSKGQFKDVEIHSTPFIFTGQTSFISILRDVTEELKQEAVQKRLVTAIEQANESVVITDSSGIVEYVNPAFTKTSGYASEEILGKNPRLLKSGEHDTSFYRNLWKTISSGKVWQGQLINRRKNGELYIEMVTISPIRDVTGKITHYVQVKRDITHEVELETKLRQAQKMEAIGTLAGGIAHDFNNILGGILGFTDMALLQSDPDSKVHDSLLHIRKGGKRAADLVQQILTFSRQSSADKKPIALRPLIKESVQLLRASLPSTITIHQDLQAENAMVLADATQLQQIIINLCTNAYQAMRDKGGAITLRLDELPCSQLGRTLPFTAEQCIRLVIEDTGSGMEPAVMERIFDPFFTTKEPGKGTGMGLSVVHGIVQDIGGDISVESAPGRGAVFTVLLPAVAALEEEEKSMQTLLPMGTEHILVVDDEEDILSTSRMMLAHLGYAVTVSKEPLAVLEDIKSGNLDCDLVITDQTMPQLTGMELSRELHSQQPDLPVILCTGFSEKVNEENIRKVGAVGLLMKPVELRDLAILIRQVLDAKEEKNR